MSKSISRFLFFFILSVSIFFTHCTEDDSTTNISSSNTKWTFLFYDNADFLGYDPFRDFVSSAYSNDNIDVLILRDRYEGSANLWYVEENHSTTLIEEKGELNMGSYETLYEFVNYAKQNYPADKYILSFYGHGGGFKGACLDESANNDWLWMEEIKRALSENGGVDLVMFSAPCVMGAVESVYELRNCTDVYIGSEDYSGYMWWYDTMQDICDLIRVDPEISEYDLAEGIINSIILHNQHWPQEETNYLTMSAIRTDRITDVINALDLISQEYITHIDELYDIVSTHRDDIHSFAYQTDIRSLVDKIAEFNRDSDIQQLTANINRSMSNAVIAKYDGTFFENLAGLTIYFPYLFDQVYNPEYASWFELDFTEDTHWDEFLELFPEDTQTNLKFNTLLFKGNGLEPPIEK